MEVCMLSKFLEFGTVFDWISPLVAMMQDIANGPSHTFFIPENCGWSGREIEHLLRRHGVATWGLMIVDHLIMLTVREAQAHWAQYLLEREGIPIEYGVLDERATQALRPAQKHDHTSPSDVLDRWLDKLESFLDL
jgi:hypothetical protein